MITGAEIKADLLLFLRRRAFWFVYVAVFAFAGMSSWITRNAAVGQLNVIRNGLAEKGGVADTTSGPCALLLDSWNAPACLATLGPGLHTYFGSLIEYHQLVEESVSSASLSGALGFAARQSASMVGFIAVTLLVITHVTSLWSSGAARPVIAALGTSRMVLHKSVTALVAPLPILLASTLGVVVSGLVPISDPLPAPDNLLQQSLVDAVRAYWMLCAVALLATAFAAFARQLVFAFVAMMGVLALSFVATLDNALYPYSPAGWIATVMHFSADFNRQVVDSFWADEYGSYSAVRTGSAMTALAAAVLGGALLTLARRRLKA